MRRYYVYILASNNRRVLYAGVTNDLRRRLHEHRANSPESFTGRYRVHKLVYFEVFGDVVDAINREKQLKAGPRKAKVTLIESGNAGWHDLGIP
jgi:putative endonuclease